MKVENYIKQLLYRYECVIVPGFGAFVTQKRSSVYDDEGHRFTPPSNHVTFNKAIQNQDGLLAETIAKAESMDFESAKFKIKLFVDDFLTALSQDKILKLSKLGMFYLDTEFKISFEPEETENYFVDSFGLEAFGLIGLAKSELSLDKAEKEGTPERTLTESTSEEKDVSKTKTYFKYAAIGILAIGLAGFVGLHQYNDHVVSHNYTESLKAETLLQERIQAAKFNFTLSNLDLETKKVETILPKYHIIAGAFRVKANAERKVKLLQQDGYPATLIGKNAYGLHQVAFASYSDQESALNSLGKIKSIENPNAWLFVKQL
ncbi:SPOR domain-containing protein [Psychroflexus sp. MES1-P1E]|uniref:HU domain-containing protein n=1 Tax=Psychroflexus sp. MES1-P1E TaxID=2058320 RepID=UPI000C7D3353|nr:SPOR domain-containing protein [Psychroflexus sp. MES1-P1E]PKG42470.1 SPOR domain-containing protein [Psychroflexus sp. MES1-P1E]